MLIELIISGIFILAVIILAANKNTSPIEISTPPVEESVISNSSPQYFRRVQQALKRGFTDLAAWEGKLSHETEKFSISNMLFDVRQETLATNEAIVELKERGLVQQATENKINNQLQQIDLANLQLGIDRKEVDLMVREGVVNQKNLMLDLKQEEQRLTSYALTIQDNENNLNHNLRRFDIDTKSFELSKERMALIQLKKDHEQADNERRLGLVAKRLEIVDYENRVKSDERNLSFSNSELGLIVEGLKVQDYENRVKSEGRKLSLLGSKLELKDTEIGLNQYRDRLNDKERSIGLAHERNQLDIQGEKNKLEHSHSLLDIVGRTLNLDKTDIELKKKANENEYQYKKRLLDIESRNNKLEEKSSKIEHRHRLMAIVAETLNLQGKRLKDEDYHNFVKSEARKVEIGKKELALGHKTLEHAYNVKSWQLQTIMQDIKHQFTELKLERKSLDLTKERYTLDLYQNSLNNLRTHIAQMYEVKKEWLRIQARENDLAYREDQLKLQRLYNDTQNKLDNLTITRKEIDYLWDKRAMEHRDKTFSFISNWW